MFQVARMMREMWEVGDLAAGQFLRQLLPEYFKLSSMPTNVVRKMLYFKCDREVPSQEKGVRQI
jgi:hypothetical protein